MNNNISNFSDFCIYSNENYKDNYDIIINKKDDEIELIFPNDYNEPLTNKFCPDNVTSLILGKYFNCKIITSDSAFWDPISIEFNNEVDATMFVLKWS
jgi:hypothetical protein